MGHPLYLEPRLTPRLAALMRESRFLHTLVDGLGSPLNVLLPDQAAENALTFRAVYRAHRLEGEVYFAHKANRSSALVRHLAATATAVDVASLEELQHALAAGYTPARIAATGPKDREFLWLGARAGVTFHVDGRAELDELANLVRSFALPRVRILLRLAAFPSSGVRTLLRRSRFGTPVAEADALLDAVERYQDAVELIGVGYHLDSVSVDEKALALEGCLTVLDACRARGMRPGVIDIGGGFGVSYLAESAQWDAYTTALTRSVLGTGPSLTWRGHGYGLRNDAGTLAGALALYPAGRRTAGAAYLDELLGTPARSFGGRPLATLLLENLYDLYVEPGRALADQCGVTLARVLEVRRGTGDEWFVRLAMNAGDCGLEDHGVLMDPLIIPRGGKRVVPDGAADTAVGVHLFGNLCLESDLITRRVVFLPRLPVPGELLCFANTAGYCMDFQAHRAEHRPEARKVAVWQDPGPAAGRGQTPDGGTETGRADGEGPWRWTLDDQYWPTANLREHV